MAVGFAVLQGVSCGGAAVARGVGRAAGGGCARSAGRVGGMADDAARVSRGVPRKVDYGPGSFGKSKMAPAQGLALSDEAARARGAAAAPEESSWGRLADHAPDAIDVADLAIDDSESVELEQVKGPSRRTELPSASTPLLYLQAPEDEQVAFENKLGRAPYGASTIGDRESLLEAIASSEQHDPIALILRGDAKVSKPARRFHLPDGESISADVVAGACAEADKTCLVLSCEGSLAKDFVRCADVAIVVWASAVKGILTREAIPATEVSRLLRAAGRPPEIVVTTVIPGVDGPRLLRSVRTGE